MSDLNANEKRILETLYQMEGGYVLNFSDRSFGDFLLDSIGIDPDDLRYNANVGSKANRLRTVWKEQPNYVVAKLLSDMTEMAIQIDSSPENIGRAIRAKEIWQRLESGSPSKAIHALAAIAPDNFEAHLSAVQTAVEQGKPEEGLDRLHTFCVGYMRRKCDILGLPKDKKEPLNSLLGKLLKHLKATGLVQSEMSERILKSNIANLEAFDHVRNNHSLAHDNSLLSKPEAELIVSHTAALVRFLDCVVRSNPRAGSNSSTSASTISTALSG